MYIDTLYRAATLPIVVKSPIGRSGGYSCNILYIISHIEGVFATQFKLAGHHFWGHTLINMFACFVRSGKEVAVKIHIQQMLSRFPGAYGDFKNIFRYTCLF
ncbi:hypothetical protein D3C86_1697970 [compost metagenome]